MINSEEMLTQMRKQIEVDPSGNGLADYIMTLKNNGLLKSEAKRLLTAIYLEYQDRVPISEEMVDGIAAV